MKICTSVRDAFSIIDFPEFEYDAKEHEMILSSADMSPLIAAEKSMMNANTVDDTHITVPFPHTHTHIFHPHF